MKEQYTMKTNTLNKATTSKATAANIKKLNDLYHAVEKAHDAFDKAAHQAETDANVLRKQKAADLAFAKFNLFRKSIPEVKFDTIKGEYFFAQNANGKNVYRLHVASGDIANLVVEAASYKEAEKKALELFTSGKVKISHIAPCVRDCTDGDEICPCCGESCH